MLKHLENQCSPVSWNKIYLSTVNDVDISSEFWFIRKKNMTNFISVLMTVTFCRKTSHERKFFFTYHYIITITEIISMFGRRSWSVFGQGNLSRLKKYIYIYIISSKWNGETQLTCRLFYTILSLKSDLPLYSRPWIG